MADTVRVTPASRKIEFFNPDSAAAKATISIDGGGAGDLTISADGDVNIGDITSDIHVGDGSANVDIVFEASGEIRTTGSAQLTITSAQPIELDGNVGIGTSSAASPLHVVGSSGNGYLKIDTDGSVASIKSDFNLDLYADDAGNNSASYQNIRFFTAGANERMRILNDGKVGIGKTDPDRHLHVDAGTENLGGIKITSGGANASLTLENDGTNGGLYRISVTSGSHGDGVNKLLIQDNNTSRITLNSAGNVGINDTTPSYKLDVNGTGRFVNTLTTSTINASGAISCSIGNGDTNMTRTSAIFRFTNENYDTSTADYMPAFSAGSSEESCLKGGGTEIIVASSYDNTGSIANNAYLPFCAIVPSSSQGHEIVQSFIAQVSVTSDVSSANKASSIVHHGMWNGNDVLFASMSNIETELDENLPVDWVVHSGTTTLGGSLASQTYIVGRVRNTTGSAIAADKLHIAWSVKGLINEAIAI